MSLVILILAVASLVLALMAQATPNRIPVQTAVLVVAITLTVMAVVGWAGAR